MSRSAALVGFVSLALITVAFIAVNRRPLDIEGMNEDDATATRLVDEYRAGLMLSGLANDTGLDTDARRWAEHLADSNSLSHDALKIDDWSEVGENVGRGGTIEIIEQAFEDSPTHEHNLSGDYSHLGIAVAVRGETTWIVQRFGRAQAKPPPPVPASATTVTLAPVTTVTLAPPVLCRKAGS